MVLINLVLIGNLQILEITYPEVIKRGKGSSKPIVHVYIIKTFTELDEKFLHSIETGLPRAK